MGLFRLLLISYLVYILITKIIRPLFRTLTGASGHEKKHKKSHHYAYGQQQSRPKEKGKISILKKSAKGQNKEDFKGGEYVDYEEVE